MLRNTALLSLLICLLTCATGGRLVGHTNNVRGPSHLHLPTIQCSTAPNDDDDARGSKESSDDDDDDGEPHTSARRDAPKTLAYSTVPYHTNETQYHTNETEDLL